MKWTKKAFLYLVQLKLHNAHVLYVEHTEDQHKMTLLQIDEIACDGLINFDPEDWPADGNFLNH